MMQVGVGTAYDTSTTTSFNEHSSRLVLTYSGKELEISETGWLDFLLVT